MQRRSSIYDRFTEPQVDRFKQIFLQFDTDGNGHIDEQELEDIMRRLGRALQPGEAKKYIEMVDIDNSGVIYFEEFLQLVYMQQHEAETMHHYKELYRNVFNRSNSGSVSAQDMRNGLMQLGHKLEIEEVTLMVTEADEDKDKHLSFDEFAGMLYRVQTEDHPVSKAGLSREEVGKVFDMWATILDEAPKLASKHSLVSRCSKPARDFRRPSRMPQQKLRKVTHQSKMLQPQVGSAQQWEMFEVEAESPDGVPVVFTDNIVITEDHVCLMGGDGKTKPRIEVDSPKPAVLIKARFCTINNFIIVNKGEGPAVVVDSGFANIVNCDITGKGGGMLVKNRAHPEVKGCLFTECRSYGLCVQESKLTAEDCEFSKNTDGGIVVEKGSQPWISECTFKGGKGCGVVFIDSSTGVLCHCEITKNSCAGVLIENGANPILWKNHIHHGESNGVMVQKSGRGMIEENDFHHNEEHEVEVGLDGNPVVRKNTMHDGTTTCIYIGDGALGTYEENEISNFTLAGVSILNRARPIVQDNMIIAPAETTGSCGVSLGEGSGGKVIDNMIVGWHYQPRMSLSAGIALHVSGKNEVFIQRNIARGTEEECRAEKMVMEMGKHDLRKAKAKK